MMTDTLYSDVLKAKRAYTVYLPKSFEQDKKKMYPVLYLLHGMWEKNDVWMNRGHVKDVMDCLLFFGQPAFRQAGTLEGIPKSFFAQVIPAARHF